MVLNQFDKAYILPTCLNRKTNNLITFKMKERKVFSSLENQVKRGMNKIFTEFNLSKKEWETIKSKFHNKCAYCGKKNTKLVKEHVYSATAGGDYSIGNIIPACSSCNARKKNQQWDKWLKKEYPLKYSSKAKKIRDHMRFHKFKFTPQQNRMTKSQFKEYNNIVGDWQLLLERMKGLRLKIMKT